MLEFFLGNLSTILVGGAVAAVVVLVILKMVRAKKQGKSACGCDCASCPGGCHLK